MLPAARGRLQEQVEAAAALPSEAAVSRSTWGRGEVGGRDEVLKAFGLTVADRPSVLELGRQAIPRASVASEDPDFEEDSEEEGLL